MVADIFYAVIFSARRYLECGLGITVRNILNVLRRALGFKFEFENVFSPLKIKRNLKRLFRRGKVRRIALRRAGHFNARNISGTLARGVKTQFSRDIGAVSHANFQTRSRGFAPKIVRRGKTFLMFVFSIFSRMKILPRDAGNFLYFRKIKLCGAAAIGNAFCARRFSCAWIR